jgi:NAD(P)H dehydrogenase (quinone)
LKRVFEDFIGIRRRMEGKAGSDFTASGDARGKETAMVSISQALMICNIFIVGDSVSAT